MCAEILKEPETRDSLLLSDVADFSDCDFFRSNKGLTQNAHLYPWILGCRLFLPSASRTPSFFAVNPVSNSAQHPAHTTRHTARVSAVFNEHSGYMAEIREAAVAISLLNAASHPVFLAVHSCRSARCGQTRICSALSRLGIYVFGWGVYPLLIMLLADPTQVTRASEGVGHACPSDTDGPE